MNTQLTNTETNQESLLSEIQIEVDVCQRKVKDLTNALCVARMAFDVYRRDTDAKLFELQKKKNILAREVVSLRLKCSDSGDSNNTVVACHDEQNESSCSSSLANETATPNIIQIKESADVYRHPMDKTNELGEWSSLDGSSISSSSSRPQPSPAKTRSAKVRRQRMFLLYHAAQCTALDGACTVSRHCDEMKRVRNHIMDDGCNDPKCNVKHCVSSRHVIRHFQRKWTQSSQVMTTALSKNFCLQKQI